MSRLPLLALLATACLTDSPDGGKKNSRGGSCDYPEVEACPDPGGLPYAAPIAPNVMLVVDRSGSMRGSKWDDVQALAPYVYGLEATSNVGLTMFPAPNQECEAEVMLDIGSSADEILALMDRYPPDSSGRTPLAESLEAVEETACLQDPHRDNVVVLLTDGEPSCASAAKAGEAARNLAEQDVPVELYILGFDVTDAADRILADIADDVSWAAQGDNYYRVADPQELMQRLERIAASLGSCEFVLDEPVPALELIVTVDGASVPPCTDASCMIGYGYDADLGIVSLAPETCRALAGQECPDVVLDRR